MTVQTTPSALALEQLSRRPVSVTKAITFEAAHRLGGPGQPVQYARLHGHSFRIEATITGAPDVEAGWVVDLGALTRALEDVAAELDHGLLNDIPGLERPTLERICAWVAARLSASFPGLSRVALMRPSLNETCTLDLEPGAS